MTFADRVLGDLGPAFNRRAGALLSPVVGGLTSELAKTDTMVQPTARGWATMFDLDLTPQPGWLGHATGSPVPSGLSVDAQRVYVRGRSVWTRGRPAAIVGAVQQLLTGTKRVDLTERDGDPYHLTVAVYAPEAPGVTVDQVLAAAETQKPVGLILTAVIHPSGSYEHFKEVHGPTFADAKADFATYSATKFHVPEEGTTP